MFLGVGLDWIGLDWIGLGWVGIGILAGGFSYWKQTELDVHSSLSPWLWENTSLINL